MQPDRRKDPSVNSEQLYYFELAYMEKSFSAAARRVPVSHQGLTKSIRALERELGVTLFTSDETTGMPIPTPYAHELFEFTSVFNSNVRLLQEAFERLREQETYTVRLGCSLGVLGAYGPALIDDFVAAHPNVRVPYWESNDTLCEKGLLENQYDIALCVSPMTEGCEGKALYESPFYFWGRRDNPAIMRMRSDGRNALRIEDIANCNIAIPGTGFKCCEHLKRAAESRGVELGRIFEMSEIFQLYGYAMAGRGLGFSNGTLVNLPVFKCDDDVVALPVEVLTWGFCIERLATHALGEAERQLWDWCVAAARDIPGNVLAE